MSFKNDPRLSPIIETLKKELNPTRLFFYGSRIKGTARPDSDYDFVAVIPKLEDRNRYDLMSTISLKLWREFGVEVQVWIYSETQFEDWKDEFSSIPETALNTGVEVLLG
jgi:predicted nucleotidyltransferase